MSAAETPEHALPRSAIDASALTLAIAACFDDGEWPTAIPLADRLRADGWCLMRAAHVERIREQAFAAGIAFAEEGHAAGQGRATVRGIAP